MPAPVSPPAPSAFNFGGPLPFATYESLRHHWRAIRDLLAMRPRPSLHLGSKLCGCNYLHYRKLVPFIEKQTALLEQADASGDWTPVEQVFFAKFGAYHLLPRFQTFAAKLKAVTAPATPAAPLSPTDPGAAAGQPPPTHLWSSSSSSSSSSHLDLDLEDLDQVLQHGRDIERWTHLGYALHASLTPAGLNRFLAGTGLEEATPAAPGADPKKAPPESILHPSQRERCLCLGFIAEQCFTAQGRARLLGTGI
jgi:hypothetical protein